MGLMSRQKQSLSSSSPTKKQRLPKERVQHTDFGNSHVGDSFQAESRQRIQYDLLLPASVNSQLHAKVFEKDDHRSGYDRMFQKDVTFPAV
jgi:hypothetical protein